jgi:hypothetical protein
MSESFGTLVDKLVTLDFKVWHLQDWVYRCVRMSKEEFEAQGYEAIHEQVRKLAALNNERNRAMAEIDTALDQAIKAGGAPVESRVKIT